MPLTHLQYMHQENHTLPTLLGMHPTAPLEPMAGPQSLNQMDQDVGSLAMTPPPPEAEGMGCEYYGDYLDLQGLCTYCLSNEHKKDTCAKYAQACC
jgi:hypothetical protein